MRKTKNPLHYSRLLCFSLMLFAIGLGQSKIAAQTASRSMAENDSLDAHAYRILFRRALHYKSLADEADASQQPKPYLRQLLSVRYALSEYDNASLLRISIAFQAKVDPIRKQMVATSRQYRARFPMNVIPPGVDRTPPPELARLQQQEDSIVLLYRDLLRSQMREDDFQRLNARVESEFGGGI